jgi:hypothetical protein
MYDAMPRSPEGAFEVSLFAEYRTGLVGGYKKDDAKDAGMVTPWRGRHRH